MAAMLHETARAKLNLTLEVKGRRPDRYHELQSLVAFTDFGDRVELEPGSELKLEIDGTFAPVLGTQGNLILAAAEAAKAACPGLTTGSFRLIKELPITSGVGGGSADAAAALRLLARANPGNLPSSLLAEIAGQLGSGFTVCGVLLANPGVELATAKVYDALNAKPCRDDGDHAGTLPQFGSSFEKLIDYARAR